MSNGSLQSFGPVSSGKLKNPVDNDSMVFQLREYLSLQPEG